MAPLMPPAGLPVQSVLPSALTWASAMVTPTAKSAVETVHEHTWHEQLVFWTAEVGIVLIVAGMLGGIYRLLRGPHLSDRALAVDTIAVQLIGLVILLTFRLGTLVYFDGIMVLSLLGFAGTVAMAQYIGRPHMDKGRVKFQKTPTPPTQEK